MLFSASWYPESSLDKWCLPGAEIIIEPSMTSIYQKMVDSGIFLTAHSPMQVAIGSKKSGVRFLSTDLICKHLEILKQLQPGKPAHIVVHAANFSDRSAEEVWEVQRRTLWSLWYKMKERHLLDVALICIENLGKISQVGSLDDIIKLCSLTDNFIPCIDFGHLYGRSLGKVLNSKEEFESVFQKLYSSLPRWKVDNMHIHFSKLLYTDKGEKKHTNFHDKSAGPKPALFIRALSSLPESFNPVIVCESSEPYRDGFQLMKNFESHKKSVLK